MRILSFRRTLVVLAALVAAEAAVILAHGQTPQGNQAAPPSFVTLDFRAVRDDGTPVTDLQLQDVTLKVDGRPRELTSLSVVQLESRQGDPTIPPLPLGFTSNMSTGREVMIVFDDESISPGNERPVREAGAKLIASLWPADRVGLVTPKGNINIGLTNLHERVATALTTAAGHASASESATDAACRTRQTLDIVKSVLGGFSADVPGTVVLVSGGMTPPGSATPVQSRGGRTTSSGTAATDVCEIRREDYDDIADAAGRASADLHVLLVLNDLSSGKAATTDMQAGLESLAGVTGNPLIRLAPEVGPRLIKETGAYYRLEFQPEAAEQNNLGHRVEISLARKGAILRAPQRVYIAKPGKASTPKTPTVADLVAGGAPQRGVGLRMSTVVRGATDKGVTTMVIVEPIDPATKLSAASVGFVDSKGQLKRANTPAAELVRFPIVTTLVLAPGYHRARVAVADSTGALGTVSEDVRAELVPAGDLKISGLLFGTLEKGSFEPRLHFSNEEAAVGYMEINNVPKGAEVTANLELTLSVDDPPKATLPMQIKNGANDTQKIAVGALPIKAFPFGEFLVRAVVNVGGKPVGRAFRTIVKSP